MNNMSLQKCLSCGAPLSGSVCQYCGAIHRTINGEPLLVLSDTIPDLCSVAIDVWGILNIIQWHDYRDWSPKRRNRGVSSPISDIRFYKKAIAKDGFTIDVSLAISPHVADVLLDHPEILDRVKYACATNTDILGAIFGVNVFECDSIGDDAAVLFAQNKIGEYARVNFIHVVK